MKIAYVILPLLALAFPVHADKQESPKKFKFDAKKAYVLARTNGTPITLERLDPKTGKFFGGKNGPKKPSKEDDDATVGGRRAFLGSTGRSYYLTSLTPGDWVIMGNSRTCMCMGSYKFTVRAGEIIDIGMIEANRETSFVAADGQALPVPDDLRDRPYAIPDAIMVTPSQDISALPTALAKLPVVLASYEVGIEFPNRRGRLVSRALGLPPIIPPRKRSVVSAPTR